jgi:translation initiation factor 2B subunit (eIF-2B alpha/beta/delta family)
LVCAPRTESGEWGALVVTHSASAAVREAVLHTPKRLLCTLSHAVEEGRAFADELRASGLAVELLEDEDAPAELDRASLLLVGADTVFRDGTLCNKIGTRMLAKAAAEREVPKHEQHAMRKLRNKLCAADGADSCAPGAARGLHGDVVARPVSGERTAERRLR